MKLHQVLNALGRELSADIFEIINDNRTKTENRKRTRMMDMWHMKFNRAMEQVQDQYSKNVIKAYRKMIDSNVLKMSIEDDCKMIYTICKMMQDVKEGDWL